MKGIKVLKTGKGAFEIQHTGYKRDMLWASDLHLDNTKCVRSRVKEDFKRAVDEDRLIMLNGDTLCLMQGKYDPRSDKTALMDAHANGYYLDRVIDEASDFLAPYANNIGVIFKGNHESSVSNRTETDILSRLVERINIKASSKIFAGGYGGFVKHRFSKGQGGIRKLIEFYHHGQWGGVVTKGTLGASRYGLIAPDADICHSGHTHDQWVLPIPRYRLKGNGTIKIEKQFHVKTGTYKEEFEGLNGWAVEKIVTPKCIGGVWGSIGFNGDSYSDRNIKITIES